MARARRRPHKSEYELDGVGPNTVFPKGSEALTNNDRLRLRRLTGQSEDTDAPRDIGVMVGSNEPENWDEYFDPGVDNQPEDY